jgi:hypothetical protein
MRRQTKRWAWLLATGLALAQGTARAQSDATGYALPDPNLPLPIGNTHPGEGQFFAAAEFVFFRQTNPMRDQEVAVRGFIPVDDSVAGFGTATKFIGTGREALDVHSVSGPNSYQPGFNIELGWKFGTSTSLSGPTLSLGFLYLVEAKHMAAATLAPPNLTVGRDQADSFLFAPVYNFPPEYAGPQFKIATGNSEAIYGIWNGATNMSLEFVQRAEQIQATYRVPVFETPTYRLSGLVGPRFFWIWERFRWRTVDTDFTGLQQPNWVGNYTNEVSNRMYGVFFGCSNEWYLGKGFACQVDLVGAALANFVTEKAIYELGTKYSGPSSQRTKKDYTFVPELQGDAYLAWYPTEAVQIRVGYSLMAFFNTIASTQPISFNFGGLDPGYGSQFRIFDGLRAGIAIAF